MTSAAAVATGVLIGLALVAAAVVFAPHLIVGTERL